MKFSAVFILSTLFVGIIDARVGSNKLKSPRRLELEEMARNDPRELLQQPECDGVLDLQAENMVMMVVNGRDSAMSYFCNPITRLENEAELEQDIAYFDYNFNGPFYRRFLEEASTEDLCEHAMDGEVIDGKQGVQSGTKSYSSCREEMEEELDYMEEILEEDLEEVKKEVKKTDKKTKKKRMKRAAKKIKKKVIKPAFKGVKKVGKTAKKATQKIVRPVGNIMAGAWRVAKKTGKKLVKVCRDGGCKWVFRFVVVGATAGVVAAKMGDEPADSPGGRPAAPVASEAPVLPGTTAAPVVVSTAPPKPVVTEAPVPEYVARVDSLGMGECHFAIITEAECKKGGDYLGLSTTEDMRVSGLDYPCGCFLDRKNEVKFNRNASSCKHNKMSLRAVKPTLICRGSP